MSVLAPVSGQLRSRKKNQKTDLGKKTFLSRLFNGQTKKKILVLLSDPSKSDPNNPLTILPDTQISGLVPLKNALKRLTDFKFTFLENHDSLMKILKRSKGKIDLIFNLADDGFNNDPARELHIPALLEMFDLPYSGAGPLCIARCCDKILVKGVATQIGIPIPRGKIVKAGEYRLRARVKFPAMVKPSSCDGGFGISRNSLVNDTVQLNEIIGDIRDTLRYNGEILVEEFLPGKDLSVGVIGNPPHKFRVLPITEDDYSLLPEEIPRICGFEAKWLTDTPYQKIRTIRANLPGKLEDALSRWSVRMFTRLECRDYARFDWRLDQRGVPRLLEVNPNPSWCGDGHLAKMSAFGGVTYPQMLGLILESAFRRAGIDLSPQREKGRVKSWIPQPA